VLPPRQVTYFYRWPDLADAIEGSSNNTRRLARALTSLGITQHEKDVEGMLKKRGCGRTPPNHFGMRYVSCVQEYMHTHTCCEIGASGAWKHEDARNMHKRYQTKPANSSQTFGAGLTLAKDVVGLLNKRG
jgi:hypothetical protein